MLSVRSCRIKPPAAGAERDAYGDLFMARGDAGQQQIGDIGARDQQHKPDRREQHVEIRLNVSDQLFMKRDDVRSLACVRLRVLLLELAAIVEFISACDCSS